jgi:Leucine-rich repeat (LRR) protein
MASDAAQPRSSGNNGNSKGLNRWGKAAAGLSVAFSVTFFVGALVFFVSSIQPDKAAKRSDKWSPDQYLAFRSEVERTLAPVDPGLTFRLQQPTSAEWKALQWMFLSDTMPETTQRFVLAAIYLAFGLSLGANEVERHECDWEIVQCSADLAVTTLNFTSTTVYGTMPTAFAYLPNLESLDIPRQELRGSIPAACYSQWSKLEYLNLEENKLSSVFSSGQPGIDIGMWTKLRELKANDNNLAETVPSSLSKLTSLQVFQAEGNTELTGPLLEYGIPHWTAIQSIEIARTRFTGTLPEFPSPTGLAQLTKLSASYVPFAGSLPNSLSAATNLIALSLGFSDSIWTGTLPVSYAAMSSLQQLSLVNLRGITGTLPSSWGETFSDVVALDLYGNSLLNGTLPTSWGRMTSMQILRISETAISGTIPTELGNMIDLQSLTLDENNLNGTMPVEICNLRDSFLARLAVDCVASSTSGGGEVQCVFQECCTVCSHSGG